MVSGKERDERSHIKSKEDYGKIKRVAPKYLFMFH